MEGFVRIEDTTGFPRRRGGFGGAAVRRHVVLLVGEPELRLARSGGWSAKGGRGGGDLEGSLPTGTTETVRCGRVFVACLILDMCF